MHKRKLVSICFISISILCSILVFLIAEYQNNATYIFLLIGLSLLVLTSKKLNHVYILSLVIIFNFLLPPMPTPFGTALRGGDIILFIFFVAILLNSLVKRKIKIEREYYLIILALMMLSIVVSIVYGWVRFNITPTKGDIIEFVKITMYFAAYRLAFYSNMKWLKRETLNRVLFTSALVIFIFGWFQIFNLFPDIVNRISLLYSLGEEEAEILYWVNKRAQSLFSNPNIYAYFISIVLSLLFPNLILKKRINRGRYIYYFVLWLIGISALFSTGSRTGLIATFVSHLYFIFMSIRLHGGISKDHIWGFLLFLFFLISVLQIMHQANPFIINRILSTFRVEEISTFNERTPHWKEFVIPKIERSLILGYGPSESVHNFSVDNEYLETVLRYGLFGFAVYFLFWAGMLFLGNKLIDSNDLENIIWGIRLHGLLAVCLIFAFFAQAFYYIPQMTLVSIYLGISRSIGYQNNWRVFL